MKEGRIFKDDEDVQGLAMNEVESYHWELANAQRNGLTQDEVNEIKRRCQSEIDALDPTNKERVNRGIYTPA
jgi:hypothetical protein